MEAAPILICFAVKEEAKYFPANFWTPARRKLITGMGQASAAKSIQEFFASTKPRLVITAGFAGGLNPELKLGTVVFDEDAHAGLGAKLAAAGAIPGKFHCANHVASTAAAKRALRQSTGADAVEMESSAIRELCHHHKIPSATVRVISDTAHEDLPLDFNALMTADGKINFFKLAGKLICGPQKIPQLMQFQKHTIFAARQLAAALTAAESTLKQTF